MNGHIKLSRSLMCHDLWTSEPFNRAQAWVDLLLLANWKRTTFFVRGNQVRVERGQVGISIKSLSDRWKWSQGKVSRFFDFLVDEDQIRYQSNNLITLITIANYDRYQENERRMQEKRGADGEQTGSSKPLNNDDKLANIPGNLEKTGTYKEYNEQKHLKPLRKCDAFDAFWSAWPWKRDKKKAEKAFSKLSEEKQQQAISGIPRFLADKKPDYYIYGATYLNGERWNDESGVRDDFCL